MTTSTSTALPGAAPGSERWILLLKNRGYNLQQAIANIKQAPVAARAALVANLRALAQTDQAGIAQAVQAAGGVVARHYWHLNAISIEVPAVAVPALRQLARVHSAWPVQAHSAADADLGSPAVPASEVLEAPMPVVPPQVDAVDAANHNVVAAWSLLGGAGAPYRGAGATLAVFDSGIDYNITGGSSGPGPHPAFDNGAGQTRVVAHLVVNEANHVNCNRLTTAQPRLCLPFPHSPPPNAGTVGYRPLVHAETCGHGTAMAAISAGSSYQSFSGFGHAPDAMIVDVACSSLDNIPGQQLSAANPWVFTDEGYLGGIEELRTYILLGNDVDVVNLSIAGRPSPDHPVSVALDSLARQEDLLIVTNAGNGGDSSRSSNGFYHGLAVGGVHARVVGTNQNLAFVPIPQSSRGPLDQNPGRYYPDVCATGGGKGQFTGGVLGFQYPTFNNWFVSGCMLAPGIDIADPAAQTGGNRVSPVRPNIGTSAASAQVAGAALLYRGYVTSASAEETRAAILLNTVGTYSRQDGASSEPGDQHSYTGRNTFGLGYVRDDVLAQFATRDSAIQPLVTTVTLTTATPVVTTSYTGLLPGERYAVVCCWRRWHDPVNDLVVPEGPLANVDLEALDVSNGQMLARSITPANSYERVVFVAPSGGAVTLRVSSADTALLTPALPVQVVGRRLGSNLDTATTDLADRVQAASGSVQTASGTCTRTDRDWQVDRIVPYDWAYGSAAFELYEPFNNAPYLNHRGYQNGFDLGWGRQSTSQMPYRGLIHILYRNDSVANVVGGPMTIRGIALRAWGPFSAQDLVIQEMWLAEGGWWQAPNPNPPTFPPQSPPVPMILPSALNAVQVLTNRTVSAPASFGVGAAMTTTGLGDFNVVLPLDVPFSYTGTGSLHMWIRVDTSSTVPVFVVDGTRDGQGQPVDYYWSVPYLTYPSLATPGWGQAPILGLIADSTQAAREVRLVARGEPWSRSGAGTGSAFDLQLFSGDALAPCLLGIGDWSSAPIAVPPCTLWLSTVTNSWPAITDAFGMARWAVQLPPGVVHSDFGLQAAVFPSGGGTFLSNGLHVFVGGGL